MVGKLLTTKIRVPSKRSSHLNVQLQRIVHHHHFRWSREGRRGLGIKALIVKAVPSTVLKTNISIGRFVRWSIFRVQQGGGYPFTAGQSGSYAHPRHKGWKGRRGGCAATTFKRRYISSPGSVTEARTMRTGGSKSREMTVR